MILPVFIPHLGCPHQCVFCNQRTISGETESGLGGGQRQLAELSTWVRPSLENQLAFYGGSFTALDLKLQQALLELAETYRAQGLFGSLRLSTRPDAIDNQELALLKAHGVTVVELGAQSLDDRVLALTERGHSARDVWEASRLIQAAGFTLGLQLMTGLPGQDRESLLQTRDQVLAIHPELVRIYPVLVIQGTPLAAAYRQGSYQPQSLEDAVEESTLLYDAFTGAGIQVIRLGLQPDRELCAPGHILAGPFHPAFGELVKSYSIRLKILRQIASLPPGNYNMVITCPKGLESMVRGQHRSNLRYFQEELGLPVTLETGEKLEVRFYDRETV